MEFRIVSILPQHYMASIHPEDGGSTEPRNVGILPQHYTASQLRRTRLLSVLMIGNGMHMAGSCRFIF
jgi:hypothetical protein